MVGHGGFNYPDTCWKSCSAIIQCPEKPSAIGAMSAMPNKITVQAKEMCGSPAEPVQCIVPSQPSAIVAMPADIKHRITVQGRRGV